MGQWVYLLYTGSFGSDGFMIGIYKYKKDALAYIKKQEGFTKDRERTDPFYENCDICKWYRIDKKSLIV